MIKKLMSKMFAKKEKPVETSALVHPIEMRLTKIEEQVLRVEDRIAMLQKEKVAPKKCCGDCKPKKKTAH